MSRKEKIKTYHGIPRSSIDNNTIFYASFDGSLKPELYKGGVVQGTPKPYFAPSPIGFGVVGGRLLLPTVELESKGTIQFWIDSKEVANVVDIAGFRFYCSDNKTLNFQFRSYPNVTNFGFSFGVNSTLNHVRVCYENKKGDFYYRVYVNGKMIKQQIKTQWEVSLKTTPLNPNYTGVYFGANTGGNNDNGCRFVISDLHISNIDRGDYFSNLPRDFIQGKAVIKNKMGQQQVKCDPLYSQLTTDIVSINSKNKCHITCTSNNENWFNGDTIEIRALGGEVIGGIIDGDTALFTIKERISSNTIKVNDVSKLQVGDSFLIFKKGSLNLITGNSRTITGVNIADKTITFSGTTYEEGHITEGYVYATETTLSSSSPKVVTKEGSIVNGTWSRLGTSNPVFTLGTNSTLTSQDLYITYSLILPCSNSDFEEFPSTIAKVYDELGNELTEVENIVVKDDFKDKVVYDLEVCPHIIKYNLISPTLTLPKNFTTEIWTSDYKRLYKDDSNDFVAISTSSANAIPQMLISFNLIEAVERKFGEIPSENKAQWLKDNLTKVDLDVFGYGQCSEGYYYQLYTFREGAWHNSYTNSVTNSSSTKTGVSLIESGAFYTLANSITEDGFVHVLVTTKASNGSVSSIIRTSYTTISMRFKRDSSYVNYYIENVRAREQFCNPIQIQKETKTVRRLIPSKKSFSSEIYYYNKSYQESLYLNKDMLPDSLLSGFIRELNTCGTGSYLSRREYSFMAGQNKNYINSLNYALGSFVDTGIYTNEPLNSYKISHGESNDNVSMRMRLIGELGTNDNIFFGALPDTLSRNASNYCLMIAFLFNSNGEVKLGIIADEFRNNKVYKEVYLTVDLPNRPLIK